MLTVILIMGSGMLIGIAIKTFFHQQEKFFKVVDAILPFAVWLLLFLLGISVGSNKVVVQNLGSLGLEALCVAVAAIVFSVSLAMIVFRLFFKNES